MVKTKNINIEIAQDIYEDILNHSQLFGFSISEFAVDALRERLEYLEDVNALRNRDKKEPRVSWEKVQKDAGLLL
ncbi:MAG: hypothetical protein FWF78_11430 [Defluviitaleaceae bacterium]|nr:hypothetical protein [Defluviitaleaceae bacterium]